MKELLIEYFVCSSIGNKLKRHVQSVVDSVEGPPFFSGEQASVPMVLLKAVTFLEALLSVVGCDMRTRPVFEKSNKISDSVYFLMQQTDLFSVVSLLTALLIKDRLKPPQLMPQTHNSIVVVSIKLLNNMFRINLSLTQLILAQPHLSEQMYHIIQHIVSYCKDFLNQSQDEEKNEVVQELLHETILLLGYYALLNESALDQMSKGETTILQNLANLPFKYLIEKKLMDILLPTLIAVSYKNCRNTDILD